jgi:hypothetical protein
VGRETRGRPEPAMSVARSVADVLRDHVPKIRDEILEDAAAFAGVGFSAHFRRHNRGQLLR